MIARNGYLFVTGWRNDGRTVDIFRASDGELVQLADFNASSRICDCVPCLAADRERVYVVTINVHNEHEMQTLEPV